MDRELYEKIKASLKDTDNARHEIEYRGQKMSVVFTSFSPFVLALGTEVNGQKLRFSREENVLFVECF